MADPLYYVLLPIVIFTLLHIWENTSFANTGVQDAIDATICPMPEFTGLWNSSGVITRTGQTYNKPSAGNNTLTLTCTPVHTPNGLDYAYGQPTINFGTFFFIADYVSETFYKIGQVLYLIGLMMAPPATFFAITVLIPIFIILYIVLGYGIYKLASPFVGG